MSKVNLLILSDDKSWVKLLKSYISAHHTSEAHVEMMDFQSGNVMEMRRGYDLLIFDHDSVGIRQWIEENRALLEAENVVYMNLVSSDEDRAMAHAIFKYTPADEFVRRVFERIKGRRTSEKVRHIVVASSNEHRVSYDFARYIGENLQNMEGNALLLSFTNTNGIDVFELDDIKDPFGRLMYYAADSKQRVIGSLETVVYKSSYAYHVPKPYPFDISLCTKRVMENLIEAAEAQSMFANVVWHIGAGYSLSYTDLLKICDKFIWFGESGLLSGDCAFETYMGLSECRLDLKTSTYAALDAEMNAAAGPGMFQRMWQELKII